MGCAGSPRSRWRLRSRRRQRVVFRRVVVSTSGMEATGIDTVDEPAILATASGGEALGPPSVTYSASGLVVGGFRRDGQTADDGTDGGWTVAWSVGEDSDGDGDADVGGRVLAARVSELDGAPVGEDTVADLTQDPGANADEAFLYAGGRFIRFSILSAYVSGLPLRGGTLRLPGSGGRELRRRDARLLAVRAAQPPRSSPATR